MLEQASIDALRGAEIAPPGHFVDGAHRPAETGETLDVISPINGQLLTTIAQGTTGDVDHAVARARAAFEDGRWSNRPPAERKKVLLKLADLIEAEALALAVLGVRDNGTEIAMAFKAEAGFSGCYISLLR